jgi:hypothetical protein
VIDPRQLVGRRHNDPADVVACMDERYLSLPAGVSAFDWRAPGRLIPDPPSVAGGPFTEIRLAGTPDAALAGQIVRRVVSSEQPIWQVLRDVRGYSLYRVEAPGVRIKDCHADSRLSRGLLALRKEGEDAQVHEEERTAVALGAAASPESHESEGIRSIEWQTVDRCFRELIAAVSLPDDLPRPKIRLDRPVIASVPRLDGLADQGLLSISYVGRRRIGLRDLLRLTDAAGRPAGWRFARFLARRLAHDFLSPRRQRRLRDWIALVAALLTSAGAIAGLVSRLLDLLG